jgi:hypothetical protein
VLPKAQATLTRALKRNQKKTATCWRLASNLGLAAVSKADAEQLSAETQFMIYKIKPNAQASHSSRDRGELRHWTPRVATPSAGLPL